MRVAIGGIEHESSSFIPTPTPLEAFARRSASGAALLRFGDANTIIDGLIRGAKEMGMEIVPLYFADAHSGGQVTRVTHEALKENLLRPLQAALPVDGVLLTLHGAYSAQGVDDGDGDILQAVRQVVGPTCRIIAVHDLHCNISKEMVEAADALIVERTYPHTDMFERGLEAARLMARTLRGEVNPTMGFRPLPLFWAASKMITAEPPMREAIAQVERLATMPGVLTASLGVGYQWVDSPIAGASTVVVTDNDAQQAQQLADDLARWVWERKEVWQREALPPAKALEMGEATGRYPIILADQADNPGGGAPGDSTEVLRLFIARQLAPAAVLYMWDPETAQQAKRAGVGATIRVQMGGKSHPLLGPPVPMEVEVLAVSDGYSTYDGPMYAGVTEYFGDTVLVRQGGLYVVVVSVAVQPYDLALTRSLGLDCRRMKYICVKSTGHFRSGFGPIAGSIYNVDAVGLLTQNFKQMPFQRLGRPVYPMDADATVDWTPPRRGTH